MAKPDDHSTKTTNPADPGSTRGEPAPARPDSIREFGRDGLSGLVSKDRALRAREISQPLPHDHAHAVDVIDDLLDRAKGRR